MRFLTAYFLLVATSPLCAKRSGGGSIGRSGGGSSYPRSTGYSGNSNPVHTYPRSTGLSGHSNNHQTNIHQTSNHHTASNVYKSEVHHHYQYSPPQQIRYGSAYHPVYHEKPPVYVYQYRDSGSRFDSLLTGLALYNLGRMSSNQNHYQYQPTREYRSDPYEICKLKISKSNGEYEETRIDCKLMSSFIWDAEKESNKVVTVNTVTTITNVTSGGSGANVTNISTTTVQNTTVVDALKVKGPSLQVSPGMQCFMIRMYRNESVLKKKVECGLLQEYARSSMVYSRNNSNRYLPVSVACLIFVNYFIF